MKATVANYCGTMDKWIKYSMEKKKRKITCREERKKRYLSQESLGNCQTKSAAISNRTAFPTKTEQKLPFQHNPKVPGWILIWNVFEEISMEYSSITKAVPVLSKPTEGFLASLTTEPSSSRCMVVFGARWPKKQAELLVTVADFLWTYFHQYKPLRWCKGCGKTHSKFTICLWPLVLLYWTGNVVFMGNFN